MKHDLKVGDEVFINGQDVILAVVQVDPEDSVRDRVTEAVRVAWHAGDRGLHHVWIDPDALSCVATGES
jgi:hypothetical protein